MRGTGIRLKNAALIKLNSGRLEAKTHPTDPPETTKDIRYYGKRKI